MKKYILTSLITALLIQGCNEDDLEGIGVGFYPTQVIEALEEDGIAYTITVQATGDINGAGTATISISNHEYIETIPAHNNGRLTLEFNNTREVSFTAEALDDDLPDDYIAEFEVVSTSGAIESIPEGMFSMIVEDDDITSLFTDDFQAGNLSNWTVYNATQTGNSWEWDEFNDNGYADVSNFNSAEVAEAWLISPEIDFTNNENETLQFESQARFNSAENQLEVVVLTHWDGTSDPSTATQTELTYKLDDHAAAGFGDFTESGEVDLSAISGNGYVAFHYTAIDSDDGSGWSVDNVLISFFDPAASDGIPNVGGNGGGNGGSSNSFTLPFDDDFESCSSEGEFNIPTNWIEENVPGTKTDRGWGCREFGREDSWAPRGSAFGGEEGTDDAWLITNGTIDLNAATSINLSVYIEERFSGPGSLTILWSADYPGSGDPTSATWTELTDATATINNLSSETFTEVTASLDDAAGEEIYLAFRYKDGTADASVAYTIDDLSITPN